MRVPLEPPLDEEAQVPNNLYQLHRVVGVQSGVGQEYLGGSQERVRTKPLLMTSALGHPLSQYLHLCPMPLALTASTMSI